MRIQVLGTGCARCSILAANAKTALQKLGLEAEIEKVTGIEEIAAYQVFATPALAIEGAIKSAGRIPSPAEIAVWITAEAKQNRAVRGAHS
jgi:small redox-active disulfide protein 2